MSENKKPIPKPTLRTTPPVKPPVTSIDTAETKTPATAEENPEAHDVADEPLPESTVRPESISRHVETDLVKRFLGLLIDAMVAGVAGFIVVSISDSTLLQWLVFGLVMLTRDSLPLFDGQSPGKKIMKTKAVKEDGSSLSGDWAAGAIRNLLVAFPPFGLVECFVILTRSSRPGDGHRLGDDWAKTKVISVE